MQVFLYIFLFWLSQIIPEVMIKKTALTPRCHIKKTLLCQWHRGLGLCIGNDTVSLTPRCHLYREFSSIFSIITKFAWNILKTLNLYTKMFSPNNLGSNWVRIMKQTVSNISWNCPFKLMTDTRIRYSNVGPIGLDKNCMRGSICLVWKDNLCKHRCKLQSKF